MPVLWWRSGLSDEGLEAIATAIPIPSPATRTAATQAEVRGLMVGEV
jgi:hypothetical protein